MSAATKLMSVNKGVSSGSVEYTAAGTYNWEAPAGVTSVTLRGRGGSRLGSLVWARGSSSYYYLIGGIFINHPSGNPSGSVNVGSTLTYETCLAYGNSTHLPAWQSLPLNTESGQTKTFTSNYYNYTTSWYRWPNSNNTRTARRIGTVGTVGSLTTATGTIPTSGNANKSSQSSNTQIRTTSYTYGTDSTALGYTFPDNSSEVTYNNVSVTPGTTYSLVVGVDADSANQVSLINISWGD